MVELFGYLVGEPNINNTRWERDARVRLINIGQLNVVEETRCLEEVWTSSVSAWVNAGDEIVTLPNNCFDDGMLNIYWVDSDSVYHELDEEHPRFDTIQNADTGTPNKFFRIGRNVHLKPLPNATGTVYIVGQKMPDELTNDSDISLIPAAYRHIAPLEAVQMAFMEDNEFGKSDRAMIERDQLMKRLKKYAKGLRSKRGSKFVLPRTIS